MYTADLKTLGQNIRTARQEANISQEQLANLACLDRAYFGRVERGQVNVSALNLIKIAAALKVGVSAFFYGIPERQEQLKPSKRRNSAP